MSKVKDTIIEEKVLVAKREDMTTKLLINIVCGYICVWWNEERVVYRSDVIGGSVMPLSVPRTQPLSLSCVTKLFGCLELKWGLKSSYVYSSSSELCSWESRSNPMNKSAHQWHVFQCLFLITNFTNMPIEIAVYIGTCIARDKQAWLMWMPCHRHWEVNVSVVYFTKCVHRIPIAEVPKSIQGFRVVGQIHIDQLISRFVHWIEDSHGICFVLLFSHENTSQPKLSTST